MSFCALLLSLSAKGPFHGKSRSAQRCRSIFLNLSLFTSAFCAVKLSSLYSDARLRGFDEQSVRELNEQYGRALVAGDLDAMRKFWNPESPNSSTHFRFYKGVLAQAKIHFLTGEVTKLEINGDKAVSYFTADERRLDKKTGAILLPFDPFYGACRSFEWIRTSPMANPARVFTVQDELGRHDLAPRVRRQERDEILEREKQFVNNMPVNVLGTRAQRHQMHAEYDLAMHYIDLQRTVAEKLGNSGRESPIVAQPWRSKTFTRRARSCIVGDVQSARVKNEAAGNKRGIAIAQENISNEYRALGDPRRAFLILHRSHCGHIGRDEPLLRHDDRAR